MREELLEVEDQFQLLSMLILRKNGKIASKLVVKQKLLYMVYIWMIPTFNHNFPSLPYISCRTLCGLLPNPIWFLHVHYQPHNTHIREIIPASLFLESWKVQIKTEKW